MIQRIQTLYLLLVVVCMVLLACFRPILFTTTTDAALQQQYEIGFLHIQNITDEANIVNVSSVWALAVLDIAIVAFALVTIFLFKKRLLQARLCIINIFLMLGYYAVLAVYIFFACKQLGVSWSIDIWAAMPLVGVILTFMAMRAIAKDEALVRAADRIR